MKQMRNHFWAAAVLAGTMIGTACHAQSQRMAIPSYYSPGPIWTQSEKAAPSVGLMIINPNSGPGATKNPQYVAQVREAQGKGVKIIGYVHTSYGKRPKSEVMDEVRKFFLWYHVDGIFFDETSNLEPDIPYYRDLYKDVKAINKKDLVVLNPGAPTLEGYMSACDIVATFELDVKAYLTKFVGAAWTAKYPASRFWHIVYGVSAGPQLKQVLKLSRQRGAGWVYLTSEGLPNPYSKLPADAVWRQELAALPKP